MTTDTAGLGGSGSHFVAFVVLQCYLFASLVYF